MSATTMKAARYPALRHRNFTLIWAGLIVSNMGTWMQNIAQSWLIYKLTGNNPLFLGYLGLSFALPMTFLTPVGGIFVDRVDRVRLLYVTQSAAALSAAVMAGLAWTERLTPGWILAASFFQALCLAFDNPARQSLIPELVPREHLLNALSLNSATYTGAALIGPALGGAMLGLVGASWLYLLNAISYLAVIGALAAMRDVPPSPRRTEPWREALLGGVRFILRHRLILVMLMMSSLAALFARSYQQLLPIFADDIWHTSASGYGQLLSAAGLGALVGALGLSSVRNLRAQGRVMVVSGIALCLALAFFALSPWFWLGLLLLIVVGVSATVFTTMISTTIQLRTPNEVRGRVMSFYAATLIGLPSLGALAVAAVARELGAEVPGGVARIALGALRGFGVVAATERLGPVAGAPRAIVLGALIIGVVVLLAAPAILRIRAPAGTGGD
ncbi:MAG: MFS transporter [Anaerolineae bacterium]|nr:MFS transporter [Anaerolineae bacterium]